MDQSWCPWDEELEESYRYHLVITDRLLFQEVQQAAEDIGLQIYLAPAGQAALLQYHTTVEIWFHRPGRHCDGGPCQT